MMKFLSKNQKLFLILIAFISQGLFSDEIPDYQSVKKSFFSSEFVLFDRHGKPLHEIRKNKTVRQTVWIELDKISLNVIHALLIAEDKRFFEHSGVDWKALADGALRYFTFRGKRGASTISMQLASILNARLKGSSKGRSISQKWDQIQYAQNLEKSWSKQEILEGYLNLVNFKGELVGIDSASRALFQKEAHGLTEMEASIIVSFFKSPSGTEPRITKRACYIAVELSPGSNCDLIREKVRDVFSKTYYIKPKNGFTYHIAQQIDKSGKQEVYTTLDLEIQILAQEILRKQLLHLKNRNVKDGAVLVLENSTGNILAYIGGAGHDISSAYQIDGVKSRRQAGSTLKPFIYGLAMDKNIITEDTVLNDNPLDIQVGTGVYSPSNYQDKFFGDVTARVALGSSLNIPAVKVLALLNPDDFILTLSDMDFSELKDANYYGLSIALGSLDITLFELTNAYRMIANKGIYSKVRLVAKEELPQPVRIFSEKTALTLTNILSDNDARALSFGLENPLVTKFFSSVKTGTSKDMRDNWCVGFNSMYTVGVWVGNFSGEPMWNVSGVTGAAPAWREIINQLSNPEILTGIPKPTSKENVFVVNPKSDKMNHIKILHPVDQTIIAIDPDIPFENQKIYFESNKPSSKTYWTLNGKKLNTSNEIYLWSPKVGKYKLSLINKENKILDEVQFEVR